MYIIQFIRGFCMALADSVPGVSGGTVAFLLGFYDNFINAIDDLVTGNMEKKKKALLYLVKLGIGWAVGMVSAILVLSKVFNSHIYQISSLFIGFIIFAIPVIVGEEKKAVFKNKINVIYVFIGIAIVSGITYFNPVSGSGTGINLASLNVSLGLYVLVAGMIAISAMVLPGISGSTLLLIMGLYVPVVSAVKEVITFQFEYLPVVIIFGVGVILGAVFVVKLIKVALAKYRPQMINLIIGLMLGSIYAIIMGPTTLENPQLPMNFTNFSILFFIIGGVIILGLQKLKNITN